MKKIKFMLLSLTLVALVGGALAFKARYNVEFCTTFAQRANSGSAYTCQIAGQNILTCPTLTTTTIADPVIGQRPVCTVDKFNGTCGDATNPLDCQLATKTLVQD